MKWVVTKDDQIEADMSLPTMTLILEGLILPSFLQQLDNKVSCQLRVYLIWNAEIVSSQAAIFHHMKTAYPYSLQ